MHLPHQKVVKQVSIILGGFVFVCLAGLACLAFLLGNVFPDFCGNEQVGLAYSPDEKYKAVIFSRDCGATTGYSTHVSVMNVGDRLNNDSAGSAFVIDGGGPFEKDHVRAIWTGPHDLEITHYSGPRIFHQEEHVSFFQPQSLFREGTVIDKITIKYKTY